MTNAKELAERLREHTHIPYSVMKEQFDSVAKLANLRDEAADLIEAQQKEIWERQIDGSHSQNMADIAEAKLAKVREWAEAAANERCPEYRAPDRYSQVLDTLDGEAIYHAGYVQAAKQILAKLDEEER